MRFGFATATRVIFGEGTLREVGPLAAELGNRALVVTGLSEERSRSLVSQLLSQDFEVELFTATGEPAIDLVQRGATHARKAGCDMVIGFGGGSVIDTGKAVAVLLTNEGDVFEYLEVIGRGKPLTEPPVPFIAIPTTAGTGAEVTRNAVLSSPVHNVKVSLRSPMMLPRLALVDPELTYSMPPQVTASTGMDALTQLIEPFVSQMANPLTDALCREGIRLAARSLRRAFHDGNDVAARKNMTLASLFGGFALANAKLGAVHGFAGPFGGMFKAPHGAICARLLPPVMAVNVRALEERGFDGVALERYHEIARIVTGDNNATVKDGVRWVRDLSDTLAIPRLSSYGLERENFPVLIRMAAKASSMKGNPIDLSDEEMEEILFQAL